MRYSGTAIVTGFSRTTEGDALLSLEKINGTVPVNMVVLRPPLQHFDTVIDCELQFTYQAVYIQDKLWAKRAKNYRSFVHLVARRA